MQLACFLRYDICSEDTNCELMGLAHVAAACDLAKAACITEDSGLLLGVVVTHEVGHVYCIYHAFQSQLCVYTEIKEMI